MFFKSALYRALSVSFSGSLALIVQLFTLAQPDLQLCPAVFYIQLKRNDTQTLLLILLKQLSDLFFMQQEPFFTHRVSVKYIPLLVWRNMHSNGKHLAIVHTAKRILQIHPALTDGLDFRPVQRYACLILA